MEGKEEEASQKQRSMQKALAGKLCTGDLVGTNEP